MLLAVIDRINSATCFRLKICDQKVNKNDLNFSDEYVKKKKEILKIYR